MKRPKLRYYVVIDGDKRTVVCEKHFHERLQGNKAEFAGSGLSCYFCREEKKIQKSLWGIIQR